MSNEKKIATAIDLLINVDRFEHIQVTKYAEAKIEYASEEERQQKEDQLTRETVDDIKRSLKLIVEGLQNKGAQPIEAIKEKVITKMPVWLESGADPNIANLARKNYEKNTAVVISNNEKTEVKRAEGSQEVSEIVGDIQESTAKPVSSTSLDTKTDGILATDILGDFKEEDLFK